MFADKGFFGGSAEVSLDDAIPEKVVQGVYKNLGSVHPEGEPISDFMNNSWNGLNGVADP